MDRDPPNGRVSRAAQVYSAAMPCAVIVLLWVGFIVCLTSGAFAPFYALLAVCLSCLAFSGVWFVRSFELPATIRWTMLGGIAVVCLAWAWQRYAFLAFVPS